MKRLLIIALASMLAANAIADNTPVVAVEITPAQVTVGESIQLRVTVLGPTWFPQPPDYPSFEITNAVVRLPPDSSRPLRQRVGSETWTGIVRNYEVIPLIGARYQIVDQVIQITYANPENVSTQLSATVDVPPIEFAAVVPQGAEGLSPYIAGRQLDLVREIDGEASTFEAGDALVVRYTAKLDGLPSMFIPDLMSAIEIPGVSIYADRPEFNDDELASRSEKLTFVFEAGGEFEIPGVELDWWNLETSSIEIASVPPMTVTVVGPPLAIATVSDEAVEPDRWRLAGLVLLAAIALFILRRLLTRLSVEKREREQRRLASEAYAFEQLNDAIRSGDLHLTYERLLGWLEKLEGTADTLGFAARFGDTDLQNLVAQLSSTLYSNSDDNLDVRKLAKPLNKARSRFLDEARLQAHTMLPNLNP
jgi:hypothetical protein